MTSTLTTLDQHTWSQLHHCAQKRDGAFRHLTLSSVDRHGHPQSRILVLRDVDIEQRLLWFHTDLRSRKWPELRHNRHVSVLGYDQEQLLQLRLNGIAELHAPKTELTTKAWSGLPDQIRRTYNGPNPGEPVNDNNAAVESTPNTGTGFSVFCVVIVRVQFLDRFEHPADGLRRYFFTYDSNGDLEKSYEVAP